MQLQFQYLFCMALFTIHFSVSFYFHFLFLAWLVRFTCAYRSLFRNFTQPHTNIPKHLVCSSKLMVHRAVPCWETQNRFGLWSCGPICCAFRYIFVCSKTLFAAKVCLKSQTCWTNSDAILLTANIGFYYLNVMKFVMHILYIGSGTEAPATSHPHDTTRINK